jgi:hypothetical protein
MVFRGHFLRILLYQGSTLSNFVFGDQILNLVASMTTSVIEVGDIIITLPLYKI